MILSGTRNFWFCNGPTLLSWLWFNPTIPRFMFETWLLAPFSSQSVAIGSQPIFLSSRVKESLYVISKPTLIQSFRYKTLSISIEFKISNLSNTLMTWHQTLHRAHFFSFLQLVKISNHNKHWWWFISWVLPVKWYWFFFQFSLPCE